MTLIGSRMQASHLREGTVVPDVPLMRERIPHKAELSFLDILLDRVERLFLGDLELGIGPAGDLDHHVQDALLLIGPERDIMKRRDDAPVLLGIDAELYKTIDCQPPAVS